MNIFVLKMMNVFSLEITGGNVLYASIFLGTDMICEHYGKEKARQAVWIGFFASIFFVVMSQFVILYEPSTLDDGEYLHRTLLTIFQVSPRIVLASMANSENVWQIILFTYLVKIIIAVMDTPFIYLSKMWQFRPHLKTKTNTNP